MPPDVTSDPDSSPAGRLAGAVALWLITASGAGLLASEVVHGHGSVVFTWLGVGIGLAGAISHAGLLLTSRYRRLPFAYRVLSVWAWALVVLFGLALALSALPLSDSEGLKSFPATLGFSLFFGAVPCLLLALIVARIVERAA